MTFSPILVLVILGDFCKGCCFASRIHIIPCNPWPFFSSF